MLYRARPTNEGAVVESANATPSDAFSNDLLWSTLETFSLAYRADEVNASARRLAGDDARRVVRNVDWETWSDE